MRTSGSSSNASRLRGLNGSDLTLCPVSLISLRQRMIVLAPLYEVIMVHTFRYARTVTAFKLTCGVWLVIGLRVALPAAVCTGVC
jgi:hypothetical protein